MTKRALAAVLVLVPLFFACGGFTPRSSSAQHELDQKHCTANSECASGLCANGRCG